MNGNKFWTSLLLGIGWLVVSVLLLVSLFSYQATAEWFYVAGLFVSVVGIAPLGLLLAYWRVASLLPQTKIDPLLLGIGWFAVSAFLFVYLFPYQATADWFRTAGLFMGGVGIAPLGLLLAHRRTVSLSAQTASLSSQTENEIARRVTDSLTKAVELLGHKRIAVRQGGIYALGRIAAENCEEHPKIMGIIAAYIRHRSRAYVELKIAEVLKAPMEALKNAGIVRGDEEPDEEVKYLIGKESWSREDVIQSVISRLPMPIDLEAAIAVIRERNAKFDAGLILDLSEAFLFRANFRGALLNHVDFTQSILRGCNFTKAELKHAQMAETDCTYSKFYGADMSQIITETTIFRCAGMDGVNFEEADLTKAIFEYASMCGAKFCTANVCNAVFYNADLMEAKFHNTTLIAAKFFNAILIRAEFCNAWLKDADFSKAKLNGADFNGAIAEDAIFKQANLFGADLTGIKIFTVEQIQTAQGNSSTKLPKGMEHPADWSMVYQSPWEVDTPEK